jgi:hypothetical protein
MPSRVERFDVRFRIQTVKTPVKKTFESFFVLAYGDDRDRTGNLRLAKPTLSQLSYAPLGLSGVGVLGFEPRTSALSELRSSQLSYTPESRLGKQKSQTDRFGPIHPRGKDRASAANHRNRCRNSHGVFQGHRESSGRQSSGKPNYRSPFLSVNRKSISQPRKVSRPAPQHKDTGAGGEVRGLADLPRFR